MYIREQDYLMHYGAKGMKWGIRRNRISKNKQTKMTTKKKEQ